MLNSTGFIGKMLVFLLLVTTPVAIVAIWLVSQGLLPAEYAVLLILTPVGPGVLIYNRLLRETTVLSQRIEHEASAPLFGHLLPGSIRSGLLPVNDLLLAIQQYRRSMQNLFKEARSHQDDAILLFNLLPDPVLVLDQKRRISRFNSAARNFFSADLAETDLTAYLRHPSLIKAVDAALGGEIESQVVEFKMAGSVGRYIEAHVTQIPGNGGKDLRVILTLHDLTTAKKTEQMRVDFVANASHELRTPLAILIGAIETLQGPAAADREAQARFLSMMHAQSRRMSQLIDDLLSLSQIEMNEHARPSDQVDVTDVLRGVVGLITTRASDLGKTIDLMAPEEPLLVSGDKDQLAQIFTNLVDNALKYGKENTAVTISLTGSEKSIAVSIIDQGEGIPSEHIPRLTERFYRVDSDRSREMGGTGLGLAIVKHIVSRHRGQLEIDSELGKGSRFTIHLPALVK
ncbi:ATP-binding protein [Sneathiella aquimaris]|uniref:ATP-binding protein n=1 Tax=Sneathiella aquimaris TaxID=2599305 RepID=UPI00146E9345|nr:ATP-binding protein [Sneathiella aquimaris]